jgi:hypothetical protein
MCRANLPRSTVALTAEVNKLPAPNSRNPGERTESQSAIAENLKCLVLFASRW